MADFLIVAKQVSILFVLIGAGALCRRVSLIDSASVRGMVNLLIYVVTPALIVDVFQRPFDAALLGQFGLAFVIAVACHLLLIGVSRLTAHGDERTLPVLRLATVFSNAGFMGLPLEQAVLGEDGVFFGIVYVATFNLFIWSWGLRTMRGTEGGFSRTSLVNPGTVGLAVGLVLFLTSFRLPAALHEPVHLMAGLNTPLAMVVIGYYLAGADLRGVLHSAEAYTAAFVRLVAFPLALVAALWALRGWLDRTMSLAMVTAAAAPVAAMVSMFAAKYGRDVDASVGLVSGTTLLSVVTMPSVIAVAMAAL